MASSSSGVPWIWGPLNQFLAESTHHSRMTMKKPMMIGPA